MNLLEILPFLSITLRETSRHVGPVFGDEGRIDASQHLLPSQIFDIKIAVKFVAIKVANEHLFYQNDLICFKNVSNFLYFNVLIEFI